MEVTPVFNRNNVDMIRQGILYKTSDDPFIPTIGLAKSTITDYDTFPYPRWYRGVPTSSEPVVAEREAGWRVRNDQCYRVNTCPGKLEYPYPSHCFETACSTVFPCFERDSKLILKPSCVPYVP